MKPETLQHYLNRNLANDTAKHYLYWIDVFKLRRPNAKRLKYADIINYLHEVKKSAPQQAQNMNVQFSAIKKYYDYLLETGQRNDHPCRKMNLMRKKKAIQVQDLFTPSELELLMQRENRYSVLELRNKVIISLMIYQGLLSSELCKLEVKNVDLDNGTIYIKGSRKNASRRLELKLNQIRLIENYLDTSRKKLLLSESGNLILTQTGSNETTDGIHNMIEPLKALYPERNLNPTTIRQSVISNMLNIAKQPLESVQLFAGHKWPSSTEQYRRKDINDQLEKINLWHPLK